MVLAGQLDIFTVGQLYEQFAALAAGGFCHVYVNVSEVTFMDSTCLSILVPEHKRAGSMNGELIIFFPWAEQEGCSRSPGWTRVSTLDRRGSSRFCKGLPHAAGFATQNALQGCLLSELLLDGSAFAGS